MRFGDWPLAVKLTAAVVALLIPATMLIVAVVLAVLQNSITAQIGNNLTTLAKSTARGVSDELADTISSVQALARSQTLIADVIAAARAVVDVDWGDDGDEAEQAFEGNMATARNRLVDTLARLDEVAE